MLFASSPDESRRVYYHEAGHGVVGARRGLAFLHLEVKDGDCGEVPVGVGPLESLDRPHSLDEIAGWQLFYAAGAAAEHLFYGEHSEHGAQADRAIHARLEKIRPAPRSGGWELDILAAIRLLERKCVEKIAAELERSKTLDVERVYELAGCQTPW
jgi:hypothetical protein